MKSIKIIFNRTVLVFILFFIISVPFGYYYIPDIGKYTSPFFELLTKWLGDNLFQIKTPYTHQILSDSTGIYLHALLLSVISFLISFTFYFLNKQKEISEKTRYWFQVFASYYLALQLLKYGFDKVFKAQFYLPEPNTAFTPLVDLSPDILYWSSIGTSHTYSVFAGLIEIIPALLLLFKRTRAIGALLACLVLLNVVFINFGFDISVKVHSCFLLFIACYISAPYLKSLFSLFIQKKQTQITNWQPNYSSKNKFLFYAGIKSIIILTLLFESSFIYIRSSNYNDDNAPRPFLHGAYNVEFFVKNGDTLAPIQTNSERFKRIFIHRQGYFITQNMNDEMNDFPLMYDYMNKQLLLSERNNTEIKINYTYDSISNTLNLNWQLGAANYFMKTKKINLDSFPLYQNSFHWTIDNYN